MIYQRTSLWPWQHVISEAFTCEESRTTCHSDEITAMENPNHPINSPRTKSSSVPPFFFTFFSCSSRFTCMSQWGREHYCNFHFIQTLISYIKIVSFFFYFVLLKLMVEWRCQKVPAALLLSRTLLASAGYRVFLHTYSLKDSLEFSF